MLNNIQKRFLLFLVGCIGVRRGLVILTKNINKDYLPILATIALIPAFGMLGVYFTNSRKTGAEVFGDKIWWNQLRIPHAFLYIMFSIYAFQKKSFCWVPLLIDVLLGLVSFLVYHGISGNFDKLLI